jgi:hypothetical protein
MDSNHRPTDYESAALTAVLRAPRFYYRSGSVGVISPGATRVARRASAAAGRLHSLTISEELFSILTSSEDSPRTLGDSDVTLSQQKSRRTSLYF